MAFGLRVTDNSTKTLITSTIGALGGSVFGRSIATSLLKMIPGAGPFISAANASTITETLGEVYITILVRIHNGEMKIEDVTTPEYKEMIQKLFMQRVQTQRKEDKSHG